MGTTCCLFINREKIWALKQVTCLSSINKQPSWKLRPGSSSESVLIITMLFCLFKIYAASIVKIYSKFHHVLKVCHILSYFYDVAMISFTNIFNL